ncbi:MAG: M20/M25/M40 family metallo-hydrolase [Anaerolineae bacterium]|jgi:acetylornithine deacetylase/succinyl-diaminopimelate desuccinylase-like protein|nr:M20/M25/M40 family metallo-hydrolase [Anaerolineae bacterium]
MKNLIEKLDRSLNWQQLSQLAQWVIDQGLQIQQIPAPTFAEAARATYVSEKFTELGLTDISTDEVFNVYGRLPGANSTLPALMVMAHTDTVFNAETDLTTRPQQNTIYGPGLGDNSIGVSGLLGLIWWLRQEQIRPECDLWFVATSREEGLGDLGGVKVAFECLKDRLAGVINLEGLAFGHIYHAGIAVRRLQITAKTEGGHSWLHFGRPSAIHGLMQLGARIDRLQPPTNPRTTYNIGVIEGGQSVNTIAPSASLLLDLRSESPQALQQLEREVYDQINALKTDDLHFTVVIVGDRPAGMIAIEHPLVQGAIAALGQLGIRASLETGSTDGNVPLAAGCPTVTIGITRGGNAHRLDEYIETAPVASGMQQLITLTLATTAWIMQNKHG